ncbi:MAG: ribosome silencing factor [Bacilli bacterium]|jgi:ribosome-associated protein|nr:ribosome silencing factor [Bacilli bacterium]MCH4235307.1 ribosome silencing factor [Bacilli bacterium]
MKEIYPEKVQVLIKALDDKKAEDIIAVDVSERMPLADYYIIATATNERQLNALADVIETALKSIGASINHIEGKNRGSEWVLIDAGDVIIHIFSPQGRQRFNLEGIYLPN